MHSADLISLAPFIALILGGLTILVLGVWPRHVSMQILTMVAIAFLFLGAVATLFWDAPHEVNGMLVTDNLSRLFTQFFMFGTAAIIILSSGYTPIKNEVREEYLSLLLFATLGMTARSFTKSYNSLCRTRNFNGASFCSCCLATGTQRRN